MCRLLLATLTALLHPGAATAELDSAVALVQDSLRVRSREDLMPAAAFSGWPFGRHRRTDKQGEKTGLAYLPLQSFGRAVGEVAEGTEAAPAANVTVGKAVSAKTAPATPPPMSERQAPPATGVAKEKKEQKASPLTMFKVGDEAQILDLSGGPLNGSWVNCSITGRGQKPGTFDIFVPGAPAGQQDYPNIPAGYLRRLRPLFYAYQVGDTVQVKAAGKDGNWVPCRITKRDPKQDTYTIHVSLAPPGQQDIAGIPGVALQPYNATVYRMLEVFVEQHPDITQHLAETTTHRAKEEHAEAPPRELPRFEVGDAAEVIVKDGPNKGTWIQVSITGKGKRPDSYTISTGFEESHNVPAADLRKSDNAMSWDV